MRFLKILFEHYINTSLHIGLAVFSLVQITKINLKISTNQNLESLILFGTVFGYNLLKNFQSIKSRKLNFKKHKTLFYISILSLLLMLNVFFKLNFQLQIKFILIGFIVLIYPYFRQFGYLKIIIVSICFALITVYFPTINQNIETENLIVTIIERLLIVFCLTIPFEILDSKTDLKSMNTIPQLIGIQNSKILGLLILLLTILLKNNNIIDYTMIFIIALALLFSNQNRNKYYTLFWVESIPILWWGLYILQNSFWS